MHKWQDKELRLIKELLNKGETVTSIAKLLGFTFSQVEHVIRRFNLKEGIHPTNISKSIKLKKEEIIQVTKEIGENLYKNYKEIKLEIPNAKKSIKGKEEHTILDISDVHIGMKNEVFDAKSGKKIITYNHKIFEKELAILQKSIFEIHSLLSNVYALKKLTIFVLGDLITNDRIFPEQVFEIDKVVGLQVWDAINYFTKFFVNLLNLYEHIDIVCIVGNHGRSTSNLYNEPVENNFEYFIYKVWEKQFADVKRINVIIPSTRFYIHKIYNWKHLLMHGDAMRGSTDSYIERQIKELTLNLGGFDVMHYGHFHKLKEREISDKVIVKQNGCWISQESYALKVYKTYSVPKQHIFGCNNKRPETWGYKIDLRR